MDATVFMLLLVNTPLITGLIDLGDDGTGTQDIPVYLARFLGNDIGVNRRREISHDSVTTVSNIEDGTWLQRRRLTSDDSDDQRISVSARNSLRTVRGTRQMIHNGPDDDVFSLKRRQEKRLLPTKYVTRRYRQMR